MRRALALVALGTLALSGCQVLTSAVKVASALDEARKVPITGQVAVRASQLPEARRGAASSAMSQIGLPEGEMSFQALGAITVAARATTDKDGAFKVSLAPGTYEVEVTFTDDFNRTVTLSGLAFPGESDTLKLDAAHNLAASKVLLAFPKQVNKFDFDTVVYKLRDKIQVGTAPAPATRSDAGRDFETFADDGINRALKAAIAE